MCVFQRENDLIDSNGKVKANTSLRLDNEEFDVDLEELKKIMHYRHQEFNDNLYQNHGGATGLASKLKTNITTGLSGNPEDLQRRVQKFGKNEIPPNPPKSFFRLALHALSDPTLILLMICAVISIGLAFYNPEVIIEKDDGTVKEHNEVNLEWIEGVAIFVAVIVVVFVTAFNDWQKERQFRGLKDRIEKALLASVVRNNEVVQVPVSELVVGDICFTKYGDLIPADGIIVQASDLKIDESSLTGETDLIKKNETNNLVVLSGTHVMEGSGRFLVTAVGLSSQTGIIMTLLGATKRDREDVMNGLALLNEKDDKDDDDLKESQSCNFLKRFKRNKKPKQRSVLQAKLGRLALQIGYAGICAAALTFVILCVRMGITEFIVKKNKWSNAYVKHFMSFLIQAITVVVVAVPEGLPLAVTLALAFAVRRMTKDNNLVRHLDACETMGSATTICSDKTGTLTTNRMTVVQCWIADEFYRKVPDRHSIHQRVKDFIFQSIAINSNYTSRVEPCIKLGELPKQIGNKTECGLLGFVNDLGGNYEKIRIDNPTETFVKVYTFNSARKMMSTVVPLKDNNQTKGYRLYSKGASEMVLSKCKFFVDKNADNARLSHEKIEDIIKTVVEKMASESLRTICVAYKDFKHVSERPTEHVENDPVYYYEHEPDWSDEDHIVNDLTCVCLTGIEDPVRDEVPDAIRKCQTSGVVVRMITGDNISTATSIALKCGIVKPSDDFLILESKEFNKRIRDENGILRQDLLDKVWPRLRVLARSSPQDKYILVNGIVESKLSTSREVVAVTGDGTNDGPALKRADVGFAMGIQGTDVAKEASDIILTDDNFTSIVKAMMWGRNVYDSIAKFLQFQLTANVAAGFFCVVCASVIEAVPIKAIQMLWVNMVMDTLASLSLATEPPTEDLLKREPYGRTKSIISSTIMKNIIGHAIYQLIILFTLVGAIEPWMGVENVTVGGDLNKLKEPSVHFTIIFNAFVLMTLFNEINARKIHNERNVFKGIFDNYIFIVIWIICFAGQVLIVCFGGIIFKVQPLNLQQWGWCVLFGFGSLVWGQVVTSVPDKVLETIYSCLCFCKKDHRGVKPVSNDSIETTNNDEDDIKDIIKSGWMRGKNRVNCQLEVAESY